MATRKPYLLRLSPELYAAVERWAADELRSVNAQIEYLITQAARSAGRYPTRRAITGGGDDAGERSTSASDDTDKRTTSASDNTDERTTSASDAADDTGP